MPTTTFANGVTLTDAAWFNEVDDTVFGTVLPPAHNPTAIWSGGNGSAAAVGIGFSADPDTGLFRVSANLLGVSVGGAERMRLDSSGNVSIGASAAGTAGLTLAQAFNVSWTESGTESIPNIFRMTSSAACVLACGVKWSASPNAVVSSYGSSIGHSAIEVQSEAIKFSVNTAAAVAVGNVVTLSERMRIDSNGYLLVGYTSSNGAYRLQVNSQIFATNATIATSDQRYKQNIQPITGALGIVAALRPVSFRWKSHPVHDFDLESEQLGFIAQEVSLALDKAGFKDGIVKSNRVVAARGDRGVRGAELADDVDEEFLGLAEGKIVPILAAAIKELKAIVDAQAARISALEAR